MKRSLLLLSLLLLNSCASVDASNETLICILACVQSKTHVKKNGPEEPGRSNTKSTEDFSDPQKDQAPQEHR